ncbi:MAG: beta-galactosidase [Acidimicrobiales bacterium]
MVKSTKTALGLAAVAALVGPAASEFRVARAQQAPTVRWQEVPVSPRNETPLGISFRPLQAEAFGLDPRETMAQLLSHPFEVVRLAAYWDRMEPAPGQWDPEPLDWQVLASEAAGKRVILDVGAVKCFGYPEFFVPSHRLAAALPEGKRVTPETHPELLEAACSQVRRVVERYRDRPSVMAWQVEHEAVDPLGIEHSWRLDRRFVAAEVAAVRASDPSRPVVMNGFLPTSVAVGAQQWWRTRDQGDSLVVARQLADIVGIDFYPRHALAAAGGVAAYLDGSRKPWQQVRRRRLFAEPDQTLMVAEGQAEPWEAVTTPPDPSRGAMWSCRPEHVIENFNQTMGWRPESPGGERSLSGYLFWGAEYWVLRQRGGDSSYLGAFERVVRES